MEMVYGESGGGGGGGGQVQNTPPIGRPCSQPEKTLKQLSALLSKLEKSTGYLRRVETLWASMVLLSGFGSELEIRDFWFSTAVLFINNIQLLNRKYADDEDASSPPRQTHGCLSKLKKVISPRLFPLWRILITFLITMKFTAAIYLCIRTASVPSHVLVANGIDPNTTLARNKKYSLLVLYALVISECFLFLFGDLYYSYKVCCCKLLHELSKQLNFGSSSDDMKPLRGFFIDSIYSPDPDRDMVTYAVDLLASDSRRKELLGVRIMGVVGNDLKKADILRNIGANPKALNTLVRMLKWDDQNNIVAASEVLSILATVKENSLAIAGMLGPIKAISFLFEHKIEGSKLGDEKDNVGAAFVDLGLQLIKDLALDQDNCEKIGKTNGLLGKLVLLTGVDESTKRDQDKSIYLRKESVNFGGFIQSSQHDQNLDGSLSLANEIETSTREEWSKKSRQEKSLDVLKLVTTQRGIMWKNIRREISEMSLVKNIQAILEDEENDNNELKKLAIDVLSNLAEENNAKECIGATPRVLEALVNIFFCRGDGLDIIGDEENHDFRLHAGKVLQQLAKKSKRNCLRILKLKDKNKKFKDALMNTNSSVPRRITVAKILLQLCVNSGASIRLQSLLRNTSDAVLMGINDKEVEMQDVMVGIASFGFKLDNWIDHINSVGIDKLMLANQLKEVLMRHKYDISRERPNICDLVVEMALVMIKNDPKNIDVFRESRIQEEMKDILEVTPKTKEIIDLLENIGKRPKVKRVVRLTSSASLDVSHEREVKYD